MLNTTLNSLCINKPDSEVDEFEEIEIIDEHDEHDDNEANNDETNSNEETIKPNNNAEQQDDYSAKSLANLTFGTLNATRKMQDRIFMLEK